MPEEIEDKWEEVVRKYRNNQRLINLIQQWLNERKD